MPRNPLARFDYRVGCDDFLLYELGRLIDEDRASLEDDEFRRLIEAGIHEHIERRLDVRAEMAFRLRSGGFRPSRILRVIEDIEAPLGEILEVIHSYTEYLLERLEQCSDADPDERVTRAADVLLEFPDDPDAAGPALEMLGEIRSAVSARVLAHVISEPMLPEDLEAKAYGYLRQMWPLARHYILYSLKPHAHEDIPFRWFQLLIESAEPSAVDRIVEEVIVHGATPAYREDLIALVGLLDESRDPETEDKVLQVINDAGTAKAAVELLEGFLKGAGRKRVGENSGEGVWTELQRAYATNRRYIAAARLLDEGKKDEAARSTEDLLREDPQYPFALMLKRLL